MTYDNIPNEKKNITTLGVQTALLLVHCFTTTDKTVDLAIGL